MSKRSSKPERAQGYPDVSRHVPWPTRLLLVARAAGQCQFPGCRRYLFEHHLTLKDGNFSEFAHIIAFSDKGPRGKETIAKRGIHGIENLLLLCHDDHHLIDRHPSDYDRKTLESYKTEHEERIRHLIGLAPSMRTVVLQIKARVAGQAVDIPVDDITTAIAPRYPVAKPGTVIDLNAFDSESRTFYKDAAARIRRRVREFYERDDLNNTRHISLFALAPIPLLIVAGNALSSTIPTDLYQRHRNPESWAWKGDGEATAFELNTVREGNAKDCVALMISLSGQIHEAQLPKKIDDAYTVYEIRPVDKRPAATLLRRREDIEHFKNTYHEFLGRVTAVHPRARVVDVFPAVPAPVAVLCGRELLRKKHPALDVWDLKKKTNEYVLTIRIN